MSTAEAATKAATDSIEILQTPTLATAYPHIGNNKLKVLQELAEIFNAANKLTTSIPRVPSVTLTCKLPMPMTTFFPTFAAP